VTSAAKISTLLMVVGAVALKAVAPRATSWTLPSLPTTASAVVNLRSCMDSGFSRESIWITISFPAAKPAGRAPEIVSRSKASLPTVTVATLQLKPAATPLTFEQLVFASSTKKLRLSVLGACGLNYGISIITMAFFGRGFLLRHRNKTLVGLLTSPVPPSLAASWTSWLCAGVSSPGVAVRPRSDC
jgi:hypothetical protein